MSYPKLGCAYPTIDCLVLSIKKSLTLRNMPSIVTQNKGGKKDFILRSGPNSLIFRQGTG
jgi:hypothetical protein